VERRALAVLVGIGGTQVAKVELVARVRGRVIGRATVAVDEGQPHSVRVLLTRGGSRSLRDLGSARIVLAVAATDAEGRRTQVISRGRPR